MFRIFSPEQIRFARGCVRFTLPSAGEDRGSLIHPNPDRST